MTDPLYYEPGSVYVDISSLFHEPEPRLILILANLGRSSDNQLEKCIVMFGGGPPTETDFRPRWRRKL